MVIESRLRHAKYPERPLLPAVEGKFRDSTQNENQVHEDRQTRMHAYLLRLCNGKGQPCKVCRSGVVNSVPSLSILDYMWPLFVPIKAGYSSVAFWLCVRTHLVS